MEGSGDDDSLVPVQEQGGDDVGKSFSGDQLDPFLDYDEDRMSSSMVRRARGLTCQSWHTMVTRQLQGHTTLLAVTPQT